MKQMTIRGIPKEVEKKAKAEAQRKGVSLNKAFLSLLERSVGIRRKERKRVYHDLDHLSGKWTREEAEAFNKTLDFQRRVDEDLWKKRG